jgi:uncharacterized protein
MEERIRIPAGPIFLEGLMDRRPGFKGAVIAHPHPLYGGDMHNNVVTAVAASYARAGYTTLRFDFRGVGASGGVFDNGLGEKEDVRNALMVLSDSGAEYIHLAGYSFGAWVIAGILEEHSGVESVVMVSPPVDFMDFSFLAHSPQVRLVVTGSHDDIAGPEKVTAMLPRWNPEAAFHVIQGADHFYGGKEQALQSILEGFLDSLSGDAVV